MHCPPNTLILIFLTPDYQTIKQNWRPRGTYCATFFFTAFCILLRTINYDSQSMNYILFTAALVYSFYRCPQLHLYASVRRCTPASANPVLYTLYLYLYTSSSQCKSQFAHKGESSNWGKTRNMGRGLCRGNIQNFDKTFFGTMTSLCMIIS